MRVGFPISGRLFREIHAELLARGRGSKQQPGECRATHHRIGGADPGTAVFVPPPPELVPECMVELEQSLDDRPTRVPGRIAGSALRVHHALQRRPVQTIRFAADLTGLSVPTVTAAMRSLERIGLVREMTGKRRNRVFGYDRYLGILSEGTTAGVERPPQVPHDS